MVSSLTPESWGLYSVIGNFYRKLLYSSKTFKRENKEKEAAGNRRTRIASKVGLHVRQIVLKNDIYL